MRLLRLPTRGQAERSPAWPLPSSENEANQPFGQEVPWPLQLFCPAQLAFAPALQPLFPLHSFFPLQQSFATGWAPSAAGAAAGGVLAAPPPQPARTPTRIPESAETARVFPMFIFAFSPETCAKLRGLDAKCGRFLYVGSTHGRADIPNSYARTLLMVSFAFAIFFTPRFGAVCGRLRCWWVLFHLITSRHKRVFRPS